MKQKHEAWEYFTGRQALEAGMTKQPGGEFWSDIKDDWCGNIVFTDQLGRPLPFPNNNLRYRRPKP